MDMQQVLVEGNLGEWRTLAELVAQRHEVKVLQAPAACLVMTQAIDCVGQTPFYLGEALMCEAAVAVNGVTGYGFTLEDDPVRALCIAIIQAGLAAKVPESGEILTSINDQRVRLSRHSAREEALIAGTKVQFAIMEG